MLSLDGLARLLVTLGPTRSGSAHVARPLGAAGNCRFSHLRGNCASATQENGATCATWPATNGTNGVGVLLARPPESPYTDRYMAWQKRKGPLSFG